MARSTYMTYLMHKPKGEDDYKKLVDIKDFPDLGGAPEMLETTTLSSPMQTNIPGIQQMDALEFTANYTAAEYSMLKELEGDELDLAVWFGVTSEDGSTKENGSDGKFSFMGRLSVYVVGGGVNEVVDMKITIAASTPITAEFPAA